MIQEPVPANTAHVPHGKNCRPIPKWPSLKISSTKWPGSNSLCRFDLKKPIGNGWCVSLNFIKSEPGIGSIRVIWALFKGVTPFLTYLATERDVAISTQNQALNALLFLYREVLLLPMVAGDFVRVRRPPGLPTVLTQDEVRELLGAMSGTYQIMTRLLYGTGMQKLLELLRLRVKDLDFTRAQIVVRAGKGGKDRGDHFAGQIAGTVAATFGGGEGDCMTAIWWRAMARCSCRGDWRASIRRPRGSGPGNGCFLRPTVQPMWRPG